MKHSIRLRFTALIFAVLTVLMAVLFLVNSFGLERFYRRQKVLDLENAYHTLDEIAASKGTDSAEMEELLRYYSSRYNITVALVDSANSKLLQSTENGKSRLYQRVQRYLFRQDEDGKTLVLKKTESYTILQAYDDGSQSANIDCFAYLSDNQTLLLMTTPVANLKESVRLANRFLLYMGVLTLLFGVFLVWGMTSRITDPIRSLAAISEKLGHMDFSVRYRGQNEDEIGVLGNNMNSMAEQLEIAVSELREANRKLRDDLAHQEEIDRMRREFIANVSHELKTPIALIQGYAEGLEDGLCEEKEMREQYLGVILDEAGRMNKLVRQLLTLSQLESDKPDLNMEVFDLRESAESVLRKTKVLAEESGAKVSLEAPDTGISVRADAFRIDEVLMNYVSNAFHHVEEGGEVIVRLLPRGERVRCEVYNSGKRIPEEDLGRLFEKFYKVDKAHTRKYGGSGIGLSIVRAIMTQHNMPCGVENCPSGVLFWFELPRAVQTDSEEHK